MMKLFLFLFTIGLFFSCSVTRNFDTTGFSVNGNTVLFNGKAMAELEGVEFALDDNKLVKEMTFSLLEEADMSVVTNMIAFLHKKHPDYEIEVQINIEKVKELKP
jgi:hypothetical protein